MSSGDHRLQDAIQRAMALAVVFVACVAALLAQEPDRPVIRVETRLVEIEVRALGRDGGEAVHDPENRTIRYAAFIDTDSLATGKYSILLTLPNGGSRKMRRVAKDFTLVP